MEEELLLDIKNSYAKLREDLLTVPVESYGRKSLEGHAKDTMMSVADLLSYLIGWAELVLKWQKKKQKGQPVDFPETGYKWNELGKLAAKFYHARIRLRK